MPVYRDKEHKTYYCKFGYKDWRGQYHQTTKRGFKKSSEAKEYEHSFKERLSGSNDMTVQNLYDLYKEDIESRLKRTTYSTRENRIELHILPYFRDVKVRDITPVNIRQWQNMLINKNIKTCGGKTSAKKIEKSTCAAINLCLSLMLNFSVRYYGLSENPMEKAGGLGPARARQEMSFWSKDVFDTFIKYVDDPELHAIYTLLFYSGIRPAEFFGLEYNSFDFVNDSLRISSNLDYAIKNKSKTSTKTPSSIRIIPMPHFVMDEIKNFLDSLSFKPKGLAIHSYPYIINHFYQYIRAAGVKRIRLYDLRHSHVSYLVHLGIPITAISKRIGHKNPKITLEIYSHMYEEDGADIAALLEESGQNQVKS